MRSPWIAATAALLLMPGMVGTVGAETRREEWREHPRIVAAVHNLEDAIKYMESAPNDFGGHKAAAIAASRQAVEQLRLAIAYREHADNR